MNENDDFKTLRRYTHKEAAAKLNLPIWWLKDWVSKDLVPHQRKGEVRGVWFTYDDIIAIGRMLPDLMTTRQANVRAEARRVDDAAPPFERASEAAPDESDPGPEGQGPGLGGGGVPVAIAPGVSAEALARFRGLRTARSV